MRALNPTWVSRSRTRRFWLSLLVVAWGIQAIVTQSLLVREALVLMFGSELAWGIVLSAWLAGVAVGGSIGGWLSRRVRQVDLILVAALAALSVAACVELWSFRGARSWLGVGPGELLGLPKMALAAVVLIAPASALVGLAFPLACCVMGERREGELLPVTSLGSVYASESAGSLIGGAAFSFWAVEVLSPIETILLCGAITIAVCGLGNREGRSDGVETPPIGSECHHRSGHRVPAGIPHRSRDGSTINPIAQDYFRFAGDDQFSRVSLRDGEL